MPETTEPPACIFFAVFLGGGREFYITFDQSLNLDRHYTADDLDQLSAAGHDIVIVFDPKRCIVFDPTRMKSVEQFKKRIPVPSTKNLYLWRATGAGSFLKEYEALKRRRPSGL